MTTEHLEVERKYDVAADAVPPDLSVLEEVDAEHAQPDQELAAIYYDTPDLRLLRAGVTLRRRTGGDDAGWHLKLPVGGAGRTELRLPLGDSEAEVPEELVGRVRVHVRSCKLVPRAEIRTRRSVRRLVDADGRVLAELADDRVEARTRGGAPTIEQWREWELELVDADQGLLDLVEPLLLAAGARPARASSKLRRVLSESLPRQAERPMVGPGSTAGELLLAYLAEQVSHLKEQDVALRGGDEEGVHQVRVGARRMRSVLATYRPLLPRAVTDELREELRWLGGSLGAARDASVLRAHLEAVLEDQPDTLVVGPVRRRVADTLEDAYRTGRDRGLEALDSPRYLTLVDRLDELVGAPPFLDAADAAAVDLVPDLLRADLKRLRRRHGDLRDAPSPEEGEHALHEVRKAAKRLRYAAESSRPVLGKRADKLARRAEAIQELLGEHQDSVVAREWLVRLAAEATAAGESSFTYGRLHALEESRAAALRRGYPALAQRLEKAALGVLR